MSGDPAAIAAAARHLIVGADRSTRYVWSRAATHLVRQALEASLDELWARRAPGVASAPMRNQLICLPFYLTDTALAQRVVWAWCASSDASHHQGFELAPTSADLLAWLDAVDGLIADVAGTGTVLADGGAA